MPPQKIQPPAEFLSSPYFHHEEKNCDVHRFGIRLNVKLILNEQPNELSDQTERVLETRLKAPRKMKCRTHNVMAWSCGWEIGKHDQLPAVEDLPILDAIFF